MTDFRDLTPTEQHELLEQIKKTKYPMCDPQPAQIDCRVQDCIFYRGGGVCYNVAPAITLNPDKTFVCWSHKNRNSISEKNSTSDQK